MILVVWVALIVLTTFYCYFCEQRLFPNKNKRLAESQYTSSKEGGGPDDKDETTDELISGNRVANMTATLPKDLRSRKEVSYLLQNL